jgi:hypothetical protein
LGDVGIEHIGIKQEEGGMGSVDLAALLVEMMIHEHAALVLTATWSVKGTLLPSHVELSLSVVFEDRIEEQDESAFIDVMLLRHEGFSHGCV